MLLLLQTICKYEKIPFVFMNYLIYICELIFKHFRAIIAAIVLILSLFILSFSQLDDNVTEIIKSVMFLSAGFLFGNIK